MSDGRWSRVGIDAQSVDAPLSRVAIFLVLVAGPTDDDLATVREALGAVDDLVKTVGFRDLDGRLSCIAGIGSALWDRLAPGAPRPAELRPFAPIDGPAHRAPSTPGDLLFHIRAERADLCFELERLLLGRLRGAITVADEVHAFRYFDARDLLGFVDGTAFAGGSYVVVQKYVHDLDAWNALDTGTQEAIIGRTKADNIELDDDAARPSHKSLATIDDGAGGELDILRDNMPFGRPAAGEFGTYFIGYAGRLWVIEQMLQRMFLGEPPGRYDRILDFSTALTGTTFFVPTNGLLQRLADPPAAAAARQPPSLGIGSLRG